ncbi:MAG: ABC transporter substrate-binding protein [Lachnospiraceae bacterium]
MKKRLVSMMLVVCMLLLCLAGCGGGSDGDTQEGSTDDGDEMPNLVVSFAYNQIPSDLEMVEEKLNEMTMEKIGCTVELIGYSYANIQDQLTLTLASPSEQLDVMLGVFRNGIQEKVSKGQLMPLDDLLAEYGQDITEAIPEEYIEACTVDGQIYAVTQNRNLASQQGVLFRKDLLEEQNIDISNISTYDDVTEVFEQLHQAYPDMVVTAMSAVKTGMITGQFNKIDNLGDFLGGLIDYDEPTVSNLFESDDYLEFVTRSKEWNKSGYIYSDIITDENNSGSDLVRSGKAMSYIQVIKPGAEAEAYNLTGYEMVAVTCTEPVALTATIQNWAWAIPENSVYPEKAMEFMNLLYSDSDIVNLLNYGIEGYHWEDDNGVAVSGEHAEGYEFSDWKTGNPYIGEVMQGNDVDVWDQLKEFNEGAHFTCSLGFSFDADSVSAEYTALKSVLDQYRPLLEWGFADDVEATLAEFNQALYDAGLETYMEEKQRQLDEFIESKE